MILAIVTIVVLAKSILSYNHDLPLPIMSYNLSRDLEIIRHDRNDRRLVAVSPKSSISPLYEGLGTHYSFIWVGSPPQRVSVIMDTGSHHTAFPCVGCKCGKHMDPGFDPKKSSSSTVKNCGGTKKCFFRQAYTEGSSWHAFKVKDNVWVGAPGKGDIPEAVDKSINFEFGCIDSETGLFRTQKVDGIMGLSAAVDTLPYQLKSQGITDTRMFALCYRTGGGVVSFGGVDTSLHDKPDSKAAIASSTNRTSEVGSLLFAKLVRPSGWFTVRLLDVMMRENKPDSQPKSIGGNISKFNAGKGAIVDSGTTDTYLPSAVKANFQNLFKQFAGRNYGNNQMSFSKEEFKKLPIIVYRLQAEGADSSKGFIDLEVLPSSYVEKHRSGKYTPRIYLTEGSGAVLGANTMNEHNVIFDQENMRVGFARSKCKYEGQVSKHDFQTSVKPDNKPPQNPKTSKPAPKIKPKPKQVEVTKKTDGGTDINAKNSSHAPFLPQKKKLDRKSITQSPLISGSVAATVVASALTSQQKVLVVSAIQLYVSKRMESLHNPCKKSLAVGCSAQCAKATDRKHKLIEYLKYVNGRIIKTSAQEIAGHENWKLPTLSTCEHVKTTISSSKNIRRLDDVTRDDSNYQLTSEKCTAFCPVNPLNADNTGENVDRNDANKYQVYMNPQSSVDDSWLPCDDLTQRRHRLILTGRHKRFSFDAGGRIVISPSDDSAYQVWQLNDGGQCLYIQNNRISTAAQNSSTKLVSEHGKSVSCAEVAVESMECAITHNNCETVINIDKSSTRTDFSVGSTSTIKKLLVVSVYFRLRGSQTDDLLTPFQLSQLEDVVAAIFKIPRSNVEIIAAYQEPTFPLSYIASNSPLQLHMRIDPHIHIPTEIKPYIPSQSEGVLGSSSKLLHSVVKEYILATVQHPEFSEVIAQKMHSMYGKISGSYHWFVPSNAYFAGVTVRDGDDSASDSNVACEHTPAIVWADYFGLTGSLSDSDALLSEDGVIMGTITPFFLEVIAPIFGKPFSLWWFLTVGVAFGISMYCVLTSVLLMMSLCCSMCPMCSCFPSRVSNRVPAGFQSMISSTQQRRQRSD